MRPFNKTARNRHKPNILRHIFEGVSIFDGLVGPSDYRNAEPRGARHKTIHRHSTAFFNVSFSWA